MVTVKRFRHGITGEEVCDSEKHFLTNIFIDFFFKCKNRAKFFLKNIDGKEVFGGCVWDAPPPWVDKSKSLCSTRIRYYRDAQSFKYYDHVETYYFMLLSNKLIEIYRTRCLFFAFVFENSVYFSEFRVFRRFQDRGDPVHFGLSPLEYYAIMTGGR